MLMPLDAIDRVRKIKIKKCQLWLRLIFVTDSVDPVYEVEYRKMKKKTVFQQLIFYTLPKTSFPLRD
jgi:hypothetical protein